MQYRISSLINTLPNLKQDRVTEHFEANYVLQQQIILLIEMT